MKINIVMFAQAREIVGESSVELELTDNATIQQLKQSLVKQYPSLGPLVGRSAFSINHEYAHDSHELPEGAEIGMIPPVSGG